MADYQQAEARLRQVFEALASREVPCCVWKSADRWQDGVEGKTDFDVLVAEDSLEEAVNVIQSSGWVLVHAEEWRSFPGLYDFLSHQDGVTHHLHVHSNIVSGEKLVKSLRPPLNKFYQRNVVKDFPPFVSPAVELALLVPRVMLKLNWIDYAGAIRRRDPAALYRRYVGEYNDLKQRCSREAFAACLSDKALSNLPKAEMLAAYEDLTTLSWSARRRIKRAVKPWRTGSAVGRRFLAVRRYLDKRSNGVGKPLPGKGITVAIIGPDGSGKTTLSRAVATNLGRHLAAARFYLGSGREQAGRLRRFVRTLTWWPYLLVRIVLKAVRMQAGQTRLEQAYRNMDDGLAARDKRRRLQQIAQHTAGGGIAICERYPLFAPFGDDTTPSLDAPAPDLLVHVSTDLNRIVARRPEDDPKTLQAKHEAFATYAESNPGLLLAADGTVEAWVDQVAEAVYQVMVSRVNVAGKAVETNS